MSSASSPLRAAILLFVTLSSAAPAPASIWDISIFRGPAPSPEDGPPESAGALRDPSKLKFEVIGIVAAYLAWIAVTAAALFIVRRRLRAVDEEPTIPTINVMAATKPTGQITLTEIEAGPKSPMGVRSPGKMSSIKSWARGHKGRTSDASLATINTRIDERVVEADKIKNMDDMANLYAAVMAHDTQRTSIKASSSTDSSPILNDNSPITPRTPMSPRSPMYPPEMAHPAYIPPTQYARPESHYEPMPPPIPESDEHSLLENPSPQRSKGSGFSLMSSPSSRLGSSESRRNKPAPITVSGRPISKPLGSADLRKSAFNSSQTSVQSTLYNPGPPPPTPGRTSNRPVEEYEMHGRPQLTSIGSDISVDSSSSKALPFRQFYQDPMRSAPATKTTFLDRRVSAMGNGPKTGVPQTPYSPYCPQTPMTPVTPRRLLNKQELKQSKKKYAMATVQERDMVQSDNDMWGTD